jgi:hypothetical protein
MVSVRPRHARGAAAAALNIVTNAMFPKGLRADAERVV